MPTVGELPVSMTKTCAHCRGVRTDSDRSCPGCGSHEFLKEDISGMLSALGAPLGSCATSALYATAPTFYATQMAAPVASKGGVFKRLFS